MRRTCIALLSASAALCAHAVTVTTLITTPLVIEGLGEGRPQARSRPRPPATQMRFGRPGSDGGRRRLAGLRRGRFDRGRHGVVHGLLTGDCGR